MKLSCRSTTAQAESAIRLVGSVSVPDSRHRSSGATSPTTNVQLTGASTAGGGASCSARRHGAFL